MATKQETIDYILDQLGALSGVSSRKMFGEYALYYAGKVVALVCDDTLFVKITDEGKKIVGNYYAEGHAYPGSKVSMQIPAEQIEDHEWLCDLIHVTAEHLPEAKPKKKKEKK
jgi:DNA transformation protein